MYILNYSISKVETFIDQFEGGQREVMLYFHTCLTQELNLIEKFRFKIPFYYGKSWICYLKPNHDKAVEFAFVRGNKLSNHQGILNSNGRKQVYGVVFEKVSDIPIQAIHEIIQKRLYLMK